MSYSGRSPKGSNALPYRAVKRAPESELQAGDILEWLAHRRHSDEANATRFRQPALALLGLLVHEVSQPITTLLGEVELALRLPGGEKEMRATFERCLRSLERVGKLVNEFRMVGEMNGATVSVSPIARLIDRIVENGRLEAESRGCRVNWNAPAEIYIRTDPELLKAALSKVLDKAIGTCPAGRAIDLELKGGTEAVVLRLSCPGLPSGMRAFSSRLEGDPEWILAAGMIELLGGSLRICGDGYLDLRRTVEVVVRNSL